MAQYTWGKYVGRVLNLITSVVIVPAMGGNTRDKQAGCLTTVISIGKHRGNSRNYGMLYCHR